MLILFSVENFRSIAEEQTFSMVASKQYDKTKGKDHKAVREKKLIRDRLPGLSGESYLRAAAIYGSNASGKSTLVDAMNCMRQMVIQEDIRPGRGRLPYEPFRFDPRCGEAPTTFFASFLWNGVRYEYEFSYNERLIVEESLFSYPKGQPRKIFVRTAGENGIDIDSPRFKVDRTVIGLLNDDCLFLSFVYSHPNFAGYELVKDVGDFFTRGLIITTVDQLHFSGQSRTGRIIEGSTGTDFQRAMIKKMLHDADVGITGAEVREEDIPEELRDFLISLSNRNAGGRDDEEEAFPPEFVSKQVVFTHEARNEIREFGIDDESLGTRQLFSLSGYIAEAYETNATLVIDELDSSLHPLLALNIINLFQGENSNNRHAQLIFTAHQVAFLMNDVFDRDQIWFTKKNNDGTTSLYPLSDYSPRKGESIWRGYLLGRYDAIPAIPDLFGILPNDAGASYAVRAK